jgi:NitT/TauT family transport system ATP-binding protein
MVEKIYVAMTRAQAGHPADRRRRRTRRPDLGINTVLPRVSANLLSGLIEALAASPFNGKADLPVIAGEIAMEADELFPVAETLQILRFAEIEGGDIRLTDVGMAVRQLGTRRPQEACSRANCSPTCRSPRTSAMYCEERANHVAPQEPLHRRARRSHDHGGRGAHAARGHRLGTLRRSLRV